MLSDILPTGFECGVLNGYRSNRGDTVAIVGAGPIGLSALLTSRFYAPAEIIMVDTDDNRLEVAKTLGATKVVNERRRPAPSRGSWPSRRGAASTSPSRRSWIPASFDVCQSVVTAGGHIANIGVHGKPVQLNLEKLWSQNITLTTRLVDTVTIPMMMKTVAAGTIQPRQLITHRFSLKDIVKAYDTFGHAMRERALKVMILND